MAFLERTTMFCIVFALISIVMYRYRYRYRKQRAIIPTNWPFVGMIPGLLVNTDRIHDYITEALTHTGGTFMWKGLWFTNMNIFITSKPLDIHHVLSKNFHNYPKGDEFRRIFDIFGNGIFASDGELWEIHRKVTVSLLKHPRYQALFQTIIWDKLENGLLPILESISEKGMDFDLQRLFERFTFDTSCKLLLDHDPGSLAPDFPYVPCVKAFSDALEVIFHRHVTPSFNGKLQQLFRFGQEKRMSDAWENIDNFIYTFLAEKQTMITREHHEKPFSLLPDLVREIKDQYGNFGDPTKLLRDILFNLMSAGKDTVSSALSWFFYNLAKNPTVEAKIIEELKLLKPLDPTKTGERLSEKELGDMVYLHGAILESLRLFPPVSLNHKCPLQPDILPSGHRVDQNTKIILSFYTMGRMESIWGEDCMEFKPERWISKEGRVKREPSYKFTTFNAGPRTCVGKDMSITQLKMVLATIIYRYRVELVEGHLVQPAYSMVLKMKHGLRVRLIKRSKMN